MNALQAFLNEHIAPTGFSCENCTCELAQGKKKCCKKYKKGKRCKSCPKG